MSGLAVFVISSGKELSSFAFVTWIWYMKAIWSKTFDSKLFKFLIQLIKYWKLFIHSIGQTLFETKESENKFENDLNPNLISIEIIFTLLSGK